MAGGAYLEFSSCYEGFLVKQGFDLHAIGHKMMGGDGFGPNAAVHPVSFFHHAGGGPCHR